MKVVMVVMVVMVVVVSLAACLPCFGLRYGRQVMQSGGLAVLQSGSWLLKTRICYDKKTL